MSTGLVICSLCNHEVHQDGPNHSWRHCDDKTPICEGAKAIYPNTSDEIVGKWCGRDNFDLFEFFEKDILPIY